MKLGLAPVLDPLANLQRRVVLWLRRPASPHAPHDVVIAHAKRIADHEQLGGDDDFLTCEGVMHALRWFFRLPAAFLAGVLLTLVLLHMKGYL